MTKFLKGWSLDLVVCIICAHRRSIYFDTTKHVISTVHMSNHFAYSVVGIVIVKVNMFDGVARILANVKSRCKVKKRLNLVGSARHFGM